MIGLFVSCSCCGLRGPEECAHQAFGWRKGHTIHSTNPSESHQSLHLYMHDARILASFNAASFVLLPRVITRHPEYENT